MATFEITEGPPGQGKSLDAAQKTLWLCKRNAKWEKKSGIRRLIYSNIKFSENFEKSWGHFIKYWTSTDELVKLRDVDIIWDEIATELDARNWPNLSVEMKRFLSQYRKRGCDIFANTQDFSMIDQRARLMISKVTTLKKLAGSRDISTTKPNPKFIWGLIMKREVLNFRETDPEKKKYALVPSFFFIEKALIELYDTTQDIPVGKAPALRHTTVYCQHHKSQGGDGTCTFCQVRHN